MVFVSSAIHAHSSHTGKDKMTPVNVWGSFVPLMYIGYFIDFAITIAAYYFYFQCNYATGVVSSTSDKILGFLGACCCHLLYVIYHIVVPC